MSKMTIGRKKPKDSGKRYFFRIFRRFSFCLNIKFKKIVSQKIPMIGRNINLNVITIPPVKPEKNINDIFFVSVFNDATASHSAVNKKKLINASTCVKK